MSIFIRIFSVFSIIFIVGCNSQQSSTSTQQEAKRDVLASYKNSPLVYIPSSIFPVLGNKDAKVKMDVFFDPWCGPCRSFDNRLLTFLEQEKDYANKISISYHLFSLGSYPNDREASLLHIEMAKNYKDLYTKFKYKVLMENINQYTEMLVIAESLTGKKLPLALLEKNNAAEYDNQRKVVKAINLQHTPTVFINSKEVELTPSVQDLKLLIDYLEAQN